MTSITGLDQSELLTQALEFIAQALVDCDFAVCAQQRTHTEPTKMVCCDCPSSGSSYTIVGWIVRAYTADGRLNETSSLDCPTIDATTMGFTVARCWPDERVLPKMGGKQDEATVELADVLSCLRSVLGRCADSPSLFRIVPPKGDDVPLRCVRVRVGDFVPDRDTVVTPYGEDAGKVSHTCAGWKFTLTVA